MGPAGFGVAFFTRLLHLALYRQAVKFAPRFLSVREEKRWAVLTMRFGRMDCLFAERACRDWARLPCNIQALKPDRLGFFFGPFP